MDEEVAPGVREGAVTSCPNCGRAAKWTTRNPFRPFCSERCKLIDLGEWASERHVIPGSEVDEFMGSELESPKLD